jgi:hypothetical protein
MAKEAKTNKPRETAQHHAAFWTWYELERHFDESLTKIDASRPTLAEWIKRFNWHKRADDLDAKQLERATQLLVEKNGKRLAEMIENHFKYGANLINIGGGYLQKKGVETGGQAIQAVKIGVEIQRTAEGLATGKQEIEHGGTIRTETEVITPKINDSNT